MVLCVCVCVFHSSGSGSVAELGNSIVKGDVFLLGHAELEALGLRRHKQSL